MLASLRVEDSVLELDRRLPSQLSRVEDTERPRGVFLEIGGLGGLRTVFGLFLTGTDTGAGSWPRLVRAATSMTLDTALLDVRAEVSTYITAPSCCDTASAWPEVTRELEAEFEAVLRSL